MSRKIVSESRESIKNAADDAVKVIAESTQTASKTIANAAESATKLLASAAESATKVLATNASEALKVSNTSNILNNGDHDILVVLKSKMEDLRIDIKDLKDNTTKRVDMLEANKLNIQDSYSVLYKHNVEKTQMDHEDRIRDNEKNITKILTFGTAFVILLGIIEGVIAHYSK